MGEKVEIKYSQSQYSPEELEQFRDIDGFIDLSKAGIVIEEGSKNQIGTADIFKYWVDFKGIKILLKQEKMLDNEPNFSVYSELLIHETAKRLGIPSAKCDLFKFGNNFKGIMSYMAIDPSKESLMMTRELIGDPPSLDEDCDTTDFVKTEDKIVEKLYEFGLSEENVLQIIADRRKQKILQLFSCEMDNHIENEGFVISRDSSGSLRVKVAPMFDNEHSFGLSCTAGDLAMDELQDNLEAEQYTKKLKKAFVLMKNRQCPSEAMLKFIIDCGEERLSQLLMGYSAHRNRVRLNGLQLVPRDAIDFEGSMEVDSTLGYLMFEDDDFSTASRTINDIVTLIEPEEIMSSVESRIHAPIPDVVKNQFETFVSMRKQALKCIYEMDRTEPEKYEEIASQMIEFAEKNANRAKKEKNRTSNENLRLT